MEDILKFTRTCQECFHEQEDTEPTAGVLPSDAYLDRKCKKCKSPALDYGSNKESAEDFISKLQSGVFFLSQSSKREWLS